MLTLKLRTNICCKNVFNVLTVFNVDFKATNKDLTLEQTPLCDINTSQKTFFSKSLFYLGKIVVVGWVQVWQILIRTLYL